MQLTRPNVSYTVNKVSQFMHSLMDDHWKTVKRIRRYLASSLRQGLKFHKNSPPRLLAFCDSNLGWVLMTESPQVGFSIFLGSNIVS